MKISKKSAASAALAGLILVSAACSDGTGGRSTAAESEVTTTTAATTQETLASAVDISELVDEKADKLENPVINYLGYYDIRGTADIDPIVRLYDKTYADYEYEGTFDEATYKGAVHVDICSWAERIEKLQLLIGSGQSPDLVDREAESFPMLASKSVYEDLTDYIDLSEPQWAGFDSLVKQYEWQGRHVYYPWHVSALPTYVFYSGALFDEYGITRPSELYDSGEWNWDTFRDCMKKFIDAKGADGEVYGVYGQQLAAAAIASTGTSCIAISDGKLVNNIGSAVIERAAAYLEGLRRDGLAVATEQFDGANPKPLMQGSAAFFISGQYQLSTFMKRNDGVDIGFVPFPKDPEADEYYSGIDSFGYLVPKGAANIEGAAKFINIARKSKIDPEFRAVIDESRLVNDKWTQEQIDFMKSFEDLSSHSVIVELYSGLDSDTANTVSEMLIDVAFHDDAANWSAIRDSYKNVIDTAVDKINNGQ